MCILVKSSFFFTICSKNIFITDQRYPITEKAAIKHTSSSKHSLQLVLIYCESVLKVSLFLPDGASLVCHPSPFVHFF